ncbi:diphosphomevalonate decarboxylase [Myxococcus llanfairpwllgwyngyllgogerychwyrndrobwllllantysiliogogogochensis]|uniref:diphosphomevalonate decarboxylase n=1 Tax=Myxococcus llanfairpwllgwyngyllgogerychwyrndrobwllllantysiliogogogochensis TaxID=2590453 RepID=A0A540WYJ1_9BACT|nr:diphosphomevalonate decarboxylase [Myxococcus llanfairpwllgwyngyllgogerychwyrndrobwllllantysiliogogogochensis]TQF14077.1 diphosphomevalonate decarboxylase [Myxococcus llanfairpwllgwyngyllgogerychwyrndrobwllllantysiliogogogochensis]
MKATALAHPNIALVKYWGKRDDALILPHQSSLSLTLSPLSVTTTVEFGVPTDAVEINGHTSKGSERERVLRLLESVRAQTKDALGPAKVVSRGDFPMAAGLASSAAGFAALAVAGRAAAGLPSDARAASILARLGSGSACRSVEGGFCEWQRGERPDGDDSFAVQRFDAAHWPDLRMVVAVLDRGEKDVKSRDGMKQTVETSPYYPAWVRDAEEEVPRARAHIARRDLQALGELCERNAWRMHSTSLAADPPLCYLNAGTLGLIQHLREHRKKGIPVWFTLDAGPNPVLLTDAANEVAAEALARACGALDVIRCVPGGDAALKQEHLF